MYNYFSYLDCEHLVSYTFKQRTEDHIIVLSSCLKWKTFDSDSIIEYIYNYFVFFTYCSKYFNLYGKTNPKWISVFEVPRFFNLVTCIL